MKYNYIADEVQEGDWALGAQVSPPTRANLVSDWTPYLPAGEPQSNGIFDSESCTIFGTNNAIETLSRFKGVDSDFSNRALSIAAGTSATGNSPHKVAETIRTVFGEVDEQVLPFTPDITTWQQYFSPNPLPGSILDLGKEFLKKWLFNHQWVFQGGDLASKQAALKIALPKSPLGVSVFAWEMGSDGKYVNSQNRPDNHWVSLVAYKEGEYWEIFDSYDSYLKQLDWNFNFGAAKVYYLTPLSEAITIWKQILDLCGQILGIDQWILKQNAPSAVPVMPTPIPVVNHPKLAMNQIVYNDNIQKWAKAIQHQEGGKPADRNMVNNNPGNLKYTPYTKSLGATGHDMGNFCKFVDYDCGYKALCQFLSDACNNLLISYHDVTLYQFTKTYAQPPNDNYANGVANAIGVPTSILIKNLL